MYRDGVIGKDDENSIREFVREVQRGLNERKKRPIPFPFN